MHELSRPTSRLLGRLSVGLGILTVLIALLADFVGLSLTPGLSYNQILMIVLGAALVAAGVFGASSFPRTEVSQSSP